MLTFNLLGSKLSFDNNNIIILDNKINIFILLIILFVCSILFIYLFIFIVFGNFENIISFFISMIEQKSDK